MSRWIEQFEAHAFQPIWEELKTNLAESAVDDETVLTSVKELARLNKVVAWLDDLINGIDPEFVPLSTWDNFNTQATACNLQIVSYNSDRAISHIQKANAHADNLLTYIRPYMVIEGKAARSMQKKLRKRTWCW